MSSLDKNGKYVMTLLKKISGFVLVGMMVSNFSCSLMAADNINVLPLNPALEDKHPFEGSYLGKKSLRRVVENTMQTFGVPGVAVGIMYQGKVVHLQGYGIRELDKAGNVDANTVFKIASNSKAFTTVALAILIDEGKLAWDGKVVDLIPEFKMRDPWLTANLTVADLLTHRTGLNQGSGDLMLWPEPNRFTRADVIYALQFFDVVKPFRSEYAYDNLLYIVAGEIIPRITNMQWNEFIDQRIMQPLNLKYCSAGKITDAMEKNLAAPHGIIEGTLQVIERSRITDDISLMAAAGGVRCSAADMMVWIETQLKRGAMPSGEQLYSEDQANKMWHPHIMRPVSERERQQDKTHFKAYGLGWHLADVLGYEQISHTGSLAGTRSFVTLVPELDLGVVVLTNGSSSTARDVVMKSIVRSYMHKLQVDWLQLALNDQHTHELKRVVTETESVESLQQEVQLTPVQLDALWKEYSGSFVDPWFGQIDVFVEADKLLMQSLKSPQLRGEMRYHTENVFRVHWFDRTLEADAFVRYRRDNQGNVDVITMEAISPDTDFSFDFPDLVLTKKR